MSMRRAVSILCVLILIPLLLLFLQIRAELPTETAPLVQEKYDSWAGVLRLWVYEGWAANATTWLNRAASSFEAAHDGVYIETRKVDAAALRDFLTSGVNPPDMILFPPGLLERVPPEKRAALTGVLSCDPRPAYQKDPDRVYGLDFAGLNVRFSVCGQLLTVLDVRPLPAH